MSIRACLTELWPPPIEQISPIKKEDSGHPKDHGAPALDTPLYWFELALRSQTLPSSAPTTLIPCKSAKNLPSAVMTTGGRGVTSIVYNWLYHNFYKIEELRSQYRGSYNVALVYALNKAGYLNANGAPLSAASIRQTWNRVRRDRTNRSNTSAQPESSTAKTAQFRRDAETSPPSITTSKIHATKKQHEPPQQPVAVPRRHRSPSDILALYSSPPRTRPPTPHE